MHRVIHYSAKYYKTSIILFNYDINNKYWSCFIHETDNIIYHILKLFAHHIIAYFLIPIVFPFFTLSNLLWGIL